MATLISKKDLATSSKTSQANDDSTGHAQEPQTQAPQPSLKASRAILLAPLPDFKPGPNLVRITERATPGGIRTHHFFEICADDEEALRHWIRVWVDENIDPQTDLCLPMTYHPEKTWAEVPADLILNYPVMTPKNFDEETVKAFTDQTRFKSWLINAFCGCTSTQNGTVRISMTSALNKSAAILTQDPETVISFMTFLKMTSNMDISILLPGIPATQNVHKKEAQQSL